jgi:transposase-like protein
LGWGEDLRPLARRALTEVIEDRMHEAIDAHLLRVAERGEADRRNGSYRRSILTELGDIELSVPRTRTYSPAAVVRAYARRTSQVDRMILACFVLGLSTRKVGEALLPVLGRPVSASAVSQVAKSLDAVVAAFHRRPLANRYKVLMLDGVVLSRKTGAGAVKRPVLVALGLLPDGRKEIIDFRLAKSESAVEWQLFLDDLWRRGLTGEGSTWCVSMAARVCSRPCPTSIPACPCSGAGRTRSGISSTRCALPISRPSSVACTRS